ncbi:MAG: LysR substrate-binding domain-containing protein [Bacteroidales bacterium]|nr:LysR substrate-binding domain-containing protein [Bacteroidales bacterium]
MTIIQLEYFLAVANHGSFSTAAEYCFVTQPSLSMQIQNLEDELGVILLDRSSKPILPTEAGKIVLEQAKEAVASFYQTKEKVNHLKGELSGKIRLGAIPTISPYLMPKFIPAFVKKYPEVELEIRDMMVFDLVDALNRDLIDMAVFAGGAPIKIKEIKLYDEKLYFYVSPKHPLFACKEVDLEDIDVKDLLMLSEGNSPYNQLLRKLFLARKKTKLPYNFANCSLETLMHMVDNTPSLTIMPGMAIDYVPEEKRKQIKHFAKVQASRRIIMAVGHTYVKESLVQAVRETILSVAQTGVAEFLI